MFRWWRFLVLVLAFAAGYPVQGAERVALVIGNNAYANTVPLRNPVRDAQAIAGVLETAGYQVIRTNDADVRGLLRALSGFTDQAREAEAAVFYYAGHGVEVKGENYLLPIDAKLEEEIPGHAGIIVLTGVDEPIGESSCTSPAPLEGPDDWRDLHEVGAGASDDIYLHGDLLCLSKFGN